MTSPHSNCLRWLSSLLLALMLAAPAHAQAPITFQYFYDDLGQLVKVVDSTGTVIDCVYDEVGNILEIKRTSVAGFPDGLEVALGSDPLDKTSVPRISLPPDDAVGPMFSVLNKVNPGEGQPLPPGDTVSPMFSVKNMPPP